MTYGIFNKKLVAVALAGAFACIGYAQAEPTLVSDSSIVEASKVNTVKRWFSNVEDGNTVISFVFEKNAPTNVAHFTGPTGSYIALDFPGVVSSPEATSSSAVVANNVLSKVRWVDTSKKGRAVIDILPGASYKVSTEGNILKVVLSNGTAAPSTVPNLASSTSSVQGHNAVLDLQYKKTEGSNGQFVLDITDPAAKVKVSRDVNNLVIDVPGASLPRNLTKRVKFDTLDTAIVGITPQARDSGTRIILEGRGTWDYAFSQNGKQISVDIFKLGDEFKVGGKRIFTGKKLSISFQDVAVRTLLQILAEFTGLNIIATDNVGGNMTLKLNDVPWDQALDIILQSRGLDMRKNGNVIWVAPKSELAEKEQKDLEERAKITDLAPTIQETFQLNYQRATEVQKMLDPSKNGALSKRGSATVDDRTNQLFVKDTADRIEEVRKLIKQVDVSVRQVSIEARIVEVNDSWGRNLGAKFGFNDPTGLGIGKIGNNKLFMGGNMQSVYDSTGQTAISGSTTASSPSNALNLSLPAGSINGASAGVFSFSLFNNALTKFLNLEVSALEADGKAKTVSTPRVVTADGKDALIEEGTEIPYQQATSSGATSISFKKAVMSLAVKPKITPDGKVSMELKVNKDSKGASTPSGPAIDTKKVDTTVLVENGGTIVIGGIIVQEESNNVNKIPLLGDIPVLGNVFKNTSKSTAKRELVIMITPRIIEGSKNAE